MRAPALLPVGAPALPGVGALALPKQSNRNRPTKQTTEQRGRGSAAVPESLPQILDSPEFRQALESWLQYKGRDYTLAGVDALVKHAAKRAAEHGTAAVIDAMERAIVNTWKGWDQDSSFSQGRKQNGKHQPGPGQRYDPNHPVGNGF